MKLQECHWGQDSAMPIKLLSEGGVGFAAWARVGRSTKAAPTITKSRGCSFRRAPDEGMTMIGGRIRDARAKSDLPQNLCRTSTRCLSRYQVIL